MIKLWRKNQYGIGTWRIWAEGELVHYAHTVSEGGAEVTHTLKVELNQSGRSLTEQIVLEINARVSRQLDKGYKTTREAAEAGSTNQLGLYNPMLAQPLEKVKLSGMINGFVQRKYDGHRCLITRQGSEVVAYSRRGKLITSISHILSDVGQWLPEDYTLDGELYIHGKSLQSISSFIKRYQHGSMKLRFHWYDLVSPEPFAQRYAEMLQLHRHAKLEGLELVETTPVERMADVYRLFRNFRSEGYEGAMLRRSVRGYEDAKRSDQLIKIKERADSEVTVISIRPSKDGWAICRVRTDWGVEFDISAPGSVESKTWVLGHPHDFIGRRLTIEYAGLTADQVPFHAVATRWRLDV